MKNFIHKKLRVGDVFSVASFLLILLTFSVVGILIHCFTAQGKAQQTFMDRTALSDRIVADISDMQQIFRANGHTDSEEDYSPYFDACLALSGDIEKLDAAVPNFDETGNALRRAESFNRYQQNLLRRVFDEKYPFFPVYQYIQRGLELHLDSAIKMAQKDTIEARNVYNTEMLTLSRSLRIAIIVSVSVGLGVAVFYVVFIRDVRKFFQKITDYCARLAERQWDIEDLPDFRFLEFQLIAETVNRMKREIRAHIAKIENQAELEKQLSEEKVLNERQRTMMVETQMSALRAQVNPHFLFNALNLIGVTSMLKDADQVMRIVEATGDILRYSLYHSEQMTDLDDELEVVDRYFYIQKCRFGSSFSAVIRNDAEGEGIQIPTMSVEPIAENCIKHGFGDRENLQVQIIARKTAGQVEISVSDNGVGFNPSEDKNEKNGGIGLYNIRKRLELLYGEGNFTMEVVSKPGKGSLVTLLLPYGG